MRKIKLHGYCLSVKYVENLVPYRIRIISSDSL